MPKIQSKNNQEQTIIIVGGGMIGLTLALSLVRNNIPVAIIESKTQNTSRETPTSKVSALNKNTINILKNINIWDKIPNDAKSPIEHMTVWDEAYNGLIEFDATHINQPRIGCIVENRAIISTIWQELSHKLVTTYCPSTPVDIVQSTNNISVSLQDGTTITGKILIGADGANSWVKQQSGIITNTKSYGHDAITTVIETEKQHNNTAYQSFTKDGPLGILPLYKTNMSSIVWSANTNAAKRLLAIPSSEFNLQLTEAMRSCLGNATIRTKRFKHPLIMRHANTYYADRIALVGDAAHTIHPLAGQGANLGFADIATLTACITKLNSNTHQELITQALARYQRHSRPGNSKMITLMSLFKNGFASTNQTQGKIRSFGLNRANNWPWLKKQLMSFAIEG